MESKHQLNDTLQAAIDRSFIRASNLVMRNRYAAQVQPLNMVLARQYREAKAEVSRLITLMQKYPKK